MRRAPVATTAVVAALALAPPSAAAAESAKRPLTVEDLWAIQRVGAPVLSPDGAQVAYAVTSYEMEENRGNADVWVMPAGGGPARRLTTHDASDTAPAWSPDARRIAFVSRRDADSAAQLYVLPLDGGEAERVTDMPTSVSSPKWLR